MAPMDERRPSRGGGSTGGRPSQGGPQRFRRPRGVEVGGLGVLGVPANSAGRTDGCARAPERLRAAGLVEILAEAAPAGVHDYGDVVLPEPNQDRDRVSGLIDPTGLAAVVAGVRETVDRILADDRFPLVLGGDCPLLLGCVAAARDRTERCGLLFVDGHEDAYLPEQSLSGEAADTEMAFALGLADASWSAQLSSILPVVGWDDVEMLGPRDAGLLKEEGVLSISSSLRFADDSALAADPAGRTRDAMSRLASRNTGAWLHIDLDVLSSEALGSVDYPQAGGISWDHLEEVAAVALADSRTVGWDVTIYNPDLDPDGRDASRVVGFLGSAVRRAAGA